MKKVGHTSKLLFSIYWSTWKATVYLKKMLKWDNKKRKNFNVYNVIFLKIIKKNTWRYHYFTPVYEKSRWNDLLLWDIEHEGLKSEVLGFFCPFTTSLPLKTYGYGVRQTKLFCHFRPLFAILPPRNPENQNFEKMKQNIWRYYHLTHVYHKWRYMMHVSWDMARQI